MKFLSLLFLVGCVPCSQIAITDKEAEWEYFLTCLEKAKNQPTACADVAHQQATIYVDSDEYCIGRRFQ